MEQQNPQKQPQKDFRGLYKNVKISVKTLDKLIIGGIVLMIALILYGVGNNGFTVTFDPRGGTDVPAQTDVMYGDPVIAPEPPTREGYRFTGWYMDRGCEYPWDMEKNLVEQSMTLYASWEKIE